MSDALATGPGQLRWCLGRFASARYPLRRPLRLLCWLWLAALGVPAWAWLPGAGELRVEFEPADSFDVRQDRLGLAGNLPDVVDTLPPLRLSLAADGMLLLPAPRLPLASEHPLWQLLAGQGHWRRGPAGGSVLQLPLHLLEQDANCIHYGQLTVKLPAGAAAGSAELTVAGQTCEYFKFTARYQGQARWRAVDAPVPPAHRPYFPLGSLAQLRAETGIDTDVLAPPVGVSAEHLTVAGLLLDGHHYQSSCASVAGDSQACAQLPLPSFSLSKSLLAGVALMRLERLAPGSRQRSIADLLPGCGDSWKHISIGQALNMQTGRYREPGYFVDEDAAIDSPLFLATSHREKLAWSCDAYPRRESPGGSWVYHTSDTYVAVSAMSALLRELRELRDGRGADIYSDLLYREAWSSLALSPLAAYTRRTDDSVAQPYGGWGQFFTADDLLQLGRWLQAEARDPQWLDRKMIREALLPAGSAPGVRAGDAGLRYVHGFWLLDASDALACTGPYWIPFLSGHGGITLALLGPETLYYYVSDNNEFRWMSAVAAVHARRPLCH